MADEKEPGNESEQSAGLDDASRFDFSGERASGRPQEYYDRIKQRFAAERSGAWQHLFSWLPWPNWVFYSIRCR